MGECFKLLVQVIRDEDTKSAAEKEGPRVSALVSNIIANTRENTNPNLQSLTQDYVHVTTPNTPHSSNLNTPVLNRKEFLSSSDSSAQVFENKKLLSELEKKAQKLEINSENVPPTSDNLPSTSLANPSTDVMVVQAVIENTDNTVDLQEKKVADDNQSAKSAQGAAAPKKAASLNPSQQQLAQMVDRYNVSKAQLAIYPLTILPDVISQIIDKYKVAFPEDRRSLTQSERALSDRSLATVEALKTNFAQRVENLKAYQMVDSECDQDLLDCRQLIISRSTDRQASFAENILKRSVELARLGDLYDTTDGNLIENPIPLENLKVMLLEHLEEVEIYRDALKIRIVKNPNFQSSLATKIVDQLKELNFISSDDIKNKIPDVQLAKTKLDSVITMLQAKLELTEEQIAEQTKLISGQATSVQGVALNQAAPTVNQLLEEISRIADTYNQDRLHLATIPLTEIANGITILQDKYNALNIIRAQDSLASQEEIDDHLEYAKDVLEYIKNEYLERANTLVRVNLLSPSNLDLFDCTKLVLKSLNDYKIDLYTAMIEKSNWQIISEDFRNEGVMKEAKDILEYITSLRDVFVLDRSQRPEGANYFARCLVERLVELDVISPEEAEKDTKINIGISELNVIISGIQQKILSAESRVEVRPQGATSRSTAGTRVQSLYPEDN